MAARADRPRTGSRKKALRKSRPTQNGPWAGLQSNCSDAGGPPPRTRSVGGRPSTQPTTATPAPPMVVRSAAALPGSGAGDRVGSRRASMLRRRLSHTSGLDAAQLPENLVRRPVSDQRVLEVGVVQGE